MQKEIQMEYSFQDRSSFYQTERIIEGLRQRLNTIGQQIRNSRSKQKNKKFYANIAKKYKRMYFKSLLELSEQVEYSQFKDMYDESYWDDSHILRIKKLHSQIAKLQRQKGTQQIQSNYRRMIQQIEQCIRTNEKKQKYLSRERALKRFNCIKAGSITYNNHLYFAKNKQFFYKGMTQITFKLKFLPQYLRLDCFCYIRNIIINGNPSSYDPSHQFILIDRSDLKIGSNTIVIIFENKQNNGVGYMSYFETVTYPQHQYVYTKFGIHGAHRLFPCFDQPDLKASFTFNIIVPNQWIVISNEMPSVDGMVYNQTNYPNHVSTKYFNLFSPYLSNKIGKFSIFKTNKLVSSFLLCVVIGEYFSITAIHSYSNYMKKLAPFIFQVLKLSLDFYEDIFGAKYPFSKCDLVFCHEFKDQGNYNVGIITLDDTYLYPEEEISALKLLEFAIAIARQTAMNWLLTIVKVKWWDQLWFNESFAEFIAHYCIQKIKNKLTSIPNSYSVWQQFLAKIVTAFREDQSWQTTHAVCAPVVNTSIAYSYLDSITKRKGSAIFKQLMFLMGEDCFFKGVKSYFKKFGLKESSVNDFFSKMKKYFTIKEFTLDEWRKSWLQTRSYNTVSVKFDPSNISKNAILTIKQKNETSFYPTLRYHKTRVAFFKEDATYDVLDVLLTPTKTTTLKYNGQNLYKAVLVNVDNWGHFKYFIDPVSLKFFKNNLHNISNSFTRMIIWHDINEHVCTANSKVNIRVADFLTYFKQHICTEDNDQVLKQEYIFAKEAINNYISIPQRDNLKKQIYDQTMKALLAATQLNRIELIKDQLIAFANPQDSNQVVQLENWRNGSCAELQSFPVTGSQGWEIIKKFYSISQQYQQTKLQKYKNQGNRYPGIKSQLAFNTCNTIIALIQRQASHKDGIIYGTWNNSQKSTKSNTLKTCHNWASVQTVIISIFLLNT